MQRSQTVQLGVPSRTWTLSLTGLGLAALLLGGATAGHADAFTDKSDLFLQQQRAAQTEQAAPPPPSPPASANTRPGGATAPA